MWPPGVEKLAVAIQDHLSVTGRVEHLLVQTLLPQPRVKTLGKAVLPRFSGLNEPGADLLDRQPDPQITGNELRAVVAADESRRTARGDDLVQDVLHM